MGGRVSHRQDRSPQGFLQDPLSANGRLAQIGQNSLDGHPVGAPIHVATRLIGGFAALTSSDRLMQQCPAGPTPGAVKSRRIRSGAGAAAVSCLVGCRSAAESQSHRLHQLRCEGRTPAVPGRDLRYLLYERLPRTDRLDAEEPSHRKVQPYFTVTDTGIGEPSHEAAMHPIRQIPAGRAPCLPRFRHGPNTHPDPDPDHTRRNRSDARCGSNTAINSTRDTQMINLSRSRKSRQSQTSRSVDTCRGLSI
jgi:hypothetical protein